MIFPVEHPLTENYRSARFSGVTSLPGLIDMAKRHPVQNTLAPLLLPLSKLYGAGMAVRRKAYATGRLPAYRTPIPCISVGNISWGGTGKTPLIQWLLGWAAAGGLRAGVLTRGYGAHPQSPPLLVKPDTPVAECGDEALMLATLLPEAAIIVDPKRSRGACLAESLRPAPDLLLLDDGFQHMGLARDVNLVLLDNDDLWDDPGPKSRDNPGKKGNWNRVIPAGSWREPVTALAAADAFLVKVAPSDQALLRDRLAEKLAGFGKPVFPFQLRIRGLRRLTDDFGGLGPESVEGDYALLCAVGNPRQVEESAVAFLGRAPVRRVFLPDHHPLSGEFALQDGLNIPVICTAKDAAKLRGPTRQNFFVLEAQPEFSLATDGQSFVTWLKSALSPYLAKKFDLQDQPSGFKAKSVIQP